MGSAVKKVSGALGGAVSGAASSLFSGGNPIMGALGGAFGKKGEDGDTSPDWGKILGAAGGLGGLMLAGGGNPLSGLQKLLAPQALNDPRTAATNDFSKAIQTALAGGKSIGSVLTEMSALPGYQGQLTAGLNEQQIADLGASNQSLSDFLAGDQGKGALSALSGIAGSGNDLNIPPELMALLNPASQNQSLGGLSSIANGDNSLMAQIQAMVSGNPNGNIMSMLMGQGNMGTGPASQIQTLMNGYSNPFLQQLGSANFASPEQQMLQQISMGAGSSGSTDILRQLLTGGDASRLLGGGTGTDINQIGQMLQQASQPGIDQGLRDLREQFSFNGLRKSTDMGQAAGTFLGNSQAALTGQLAQLIPGINAQRDTTSLGALQSLIGGAGQLGSTGQGDLAQRIQALTAAGGLGQGSQSLTLQSLLGGGDQTLQQLQAMMGGASQQGQLGTAGQSNIIQALLGAGGMGQQSQQTGLSALQQLLGTQAGAAEGLAGLGQQQAGLNTTNQQSQAGILAQLFGGQQGNALQAALAQPGALDMLSKLPQSLIGQNYGLNQQGQQTQQGGLDALYAEFQRQQSMANPMLQFLGGAGAQQYTGSMPTQLMSLLLSGSSMKQSK